MNSDLGFLVKIGVSFRKINWIFRGLKRNGSIPINFNRKIDLRYEAFWVKSLELITIVSQGITVTEISDYRHYKSF